MIRTLVVLCAIGAIWLPGAFAQAPDCSLVPGWQQQGDRRSYDTDNLFEYMDGNSEGYFIYGFVKMNGVNCQAAGNTLVFDVSEMGTPELAFGMFSATKDGRRPVEKIGMSAQISGRKAILVKDKYYIEWSTTKDDEAALRAFTVAMEKRVPGETAIPAALGWFPPDKLQPGSVRLVPESVLGLRLLKRGYIALYDYGKAFLVTEASPEAAAAILPKLRDRIGDTKPAKVGDEGFEATDKYLGRLCFFRKGKYLAGFAGVAEGQDAVAAASILAAKIQ
jgi:hypothetical protein